MQLGFAGVFLFFNYLYINNYFSVIKKIVNNQLAEEGKNINSFKISPLYPPHFNLNHLFNKNRCAQVLSTDWIEANSFKFSNTYVKWSKVKKTEKIKYDINGILHITQCKYFNEKYVGAGKCQMCNCFKGKNKKKLFVKCSYRYNNITWRDK